jgi:hypothetical protein
MERFLVIGATGVAGGAAIQAVRERFPGAHVTALWYGRKPDEVTAIDGADTVLFGDIGDPATDEAVAAASGDRFTGLFYATAMGEVGFPAFLATPEQIAASNRLSFDPLPRLEERFDLGFILAYSTFFNLEHQKITYGAMAHSKAAIEQWVAQDGRSAGRNADGTASGTRRVCIRAGAFTSASSMAIKLLVRRKAAQLAAVDNQILREAFVGTKPSEAVDRLEEAVFEEELERFGDTRTDQTGLVAAHLAAFDHPEARFVCVCGKRVWLEDGPQAVDKA